MGNEGSYAALGLKIWKSQIERGGQAFWRPFPRGGSAGNSPPVETDCFICGVTLRRYTTRCCRC